MSFRISILLLYCSPIVAQEGGNAEFLDHKVFYNKYTFADFFKVGSPWNWEFDVYARTQSDPGEQNIFSNPMRLSFRPWIGYQPAKLTRFSISPIALMNSFSRLTLDDDSPGRSERELRSSFQINNNAYYKRFNFTHRMRFESRWRGIDNPVVFQNYRFRYRLRVRTPLNTDYFYINNTLYLNIYSEIHLEFGNNFGGTNYLTQNRSYGGIGYRFWDWARVELGYIHQYVPRGDHLYVDLVNGPMVYLYIDLMSQLKKYR
ncbi:MAG: DUF2490 domain-containing protein [Cryomorphaceae bacterium]|nr:DUF2490 domain-containing protein [Cryomorphaceae bacterium]